MKRLRPSLGKNIVATLVRSAVQRYHTEDVQAIREYRPQRISSSKTTRIAHAAPTGDNGSCTVNKGSAFSIPAFVSYSTPFYSAVQLA